MSDTILAIYVSGVFRPLESVDLPDGARVEVIPWNPSTTSPAAWPAGCFEQTAGAFAGEESDRPPQGELPTRDDW